MPSFEELTATHLWEIANEMKSQSPAASRFYMFNLEQLWFIKRQTRKLFKKRPTWCTHCGSLWAPENYKVRVKARPRLNCQIKKLLTYEKKKPWKLTLRQKKKLRSYKNSTTKIVYTCFKCKKVSSYQWLNVLPKIRPPPMQSTPIPKIKVKDTNAGLFITTPQPSADQEKIVVSIKPKEEPLLPAAFRTPLSCSNESLSAKQEGLSKRKRKSLLAQVTKSAKKSKKTNLSAFLVSL